VADLLSRLGGGASGEEAPTRLPPERFDAARFRRAGLVSGWHEAQVGSAVAGRHRGRLWAVAEAGLDRLDERTPKRRVRARAFFGLLVAVELVGTGRRSCLLRRRGAIIRTLRRWSPPARDLDPVGLTGGLADRYEAWGDGSEMARALLAEGGRRDARQDRGGDRGAGAVRAHGHGAAGGAAAAAAVAEGGGEGDEARVAEAVERLRRQLGVVGRLVEETK
jgi:hypothetical protein